jgi:glycosyltransferase involved in cell wall biosynthesis
VITVVVATRNRSDLLSECLASLMAQRCRHDWRAIVVDNGSSDATREVVTSFAACEPRLSYVLEPRPGVNKARNRGLCEASTPFVLYVDDECTFPSGYLDIACDVAAQAGVVCFGGPILARFQSTPVRPAWYKDVYGASSLPENNVRGAPPRLSAGNLGVSRAALRKIGGFDETFGPVGSRMRYGEENWLVATMWDTFGPASVVYEPRLVNYHLVRPEKYRWAVILAENYRRGAARGRLLALGLDEDSRVRPAPDASFQPAPQKPASPAPEHRSAPFSVADLLLDVTFLRLASERDRYPYWQNVVFERWMGYVRRIGLVAAYVGSKFARGRRGGPPV